ncbi:hypothetical protein Tco_0490685 [Tanacetum coccineum]
MGSWYVNKGLGYIAKRAQPVLYDADTLLHPAHHPVRIWDSEDVLVHQVVSMKKMNEKPGHVRPANGFYDKLNAVKFVPQTELSHEQVYGLSANEIASNASNPATPVTPFVHNRPPPSQGYCFIFKVYAVFNHMKFVEQQLVPFYDHFKKHIESANETIFKEVKEYEQIFDDLDAEYERCVLENQNLTIEKKNLLIRNDCLIAECLEKDICSIVLSSDIVVPPSSNCLCEELRSACDREPIKFLNLHFSASMQFLNINKFKKKCFKRKRHYQESGKLRSTSRECLIGRIQVRIQIDGYKAENVNLKRRYEELSKSNAYSRSTFTAKINALTVENAKLKN